MKKMKEPSITKVEFIEVIGLLREQDKKDHVFADFMENYLDGRFVPMMSEKANSAAMKSLALHFGDRLTSKHDMTWIEWWAYECDWGAKDNKAHINGVEFPVSDASMFYDMMVMWMNNGKKNDK